MLILIGMPIVQIILFGFAISTEVKDIKTAVVAPNLNADAHYLIDRLDAGEYFSVKYVTGSVKEVERLFRQNRIELAVVLPDDLQRGRFDSESVQLIVDATDPNLALTRTAYAQNVLSAIRQSLTANLSAEAGEPHLKVTTKLLYNPQMKSAYNFTEGWEAAAGARQINMLLVNPASVCAPIVYDTSMMSPPSAQSKGKWLYYERYYYDVFALNQRLPGILANMGGTGTLGSLTFTTSAGADATHTIISGLAPAPYGMAYVAKDGASAQLPTYGQDLSSGWTPVVNGTSIETAASHVITVALVNTTKGDIATAGGSATAVVGT